MKKVPKNTEPVLTKAAVEKATLEQHVRDVLTELTEELRLLRHPQGSTYVIADRDRLKVVLREFLIKSDEEEKVRIAEYAEQSRLGRQAHMESKLETDE